MTATKSAPTETALPAPDQTQARISCSRGMGDWLLRHNVSRMRALNSGLGDVGTVDPASGAFAARTFFPGFARRLAFHNDFAIVALSLQRSGTSKGL